MARSRSIRSAGDDGPQPFPTSACRKTAPTCRNAAPPPARPPCWTRSPYSTAAVVAPRSGSSPKGVRYAWSSLASRPADLRWMQQRTRSGRDPLPRPGQQHGRLVHAERHRVHPQEQRGPARANRQARLASDGGDPLVPRGFCPCRGGGEYRDCDVRPPLATRIAGGFRRRGGAAHEASGRPADRRDGPGHAESERDVGRACRRRGSTHRSGTTDRARCPAWRRPIPSTTCTNIWVSWWHMPG